MVITLGSAEPVIAQTAEGGPYAEVPAEAEATSLREALFEDWWQADYATSDLTLRAVTGTVWSTGSGPASLALNLDGWSQQVEDDPFCRTGGFTGCTDDVGGRLSLQARLELATDLELRLHAGTSLATGAAAADLGAAVVWWFSEDFGLVFGVSYLHPLPTGGTGSAVPAMLDFERAFAHETPYDMPTHVAPGYWTGGLGIISRDRP